MAKLFTEEQMSDPWEWCLSVIAKRRIKPKVVAERSGLAWSTCRALLSGANKKPRYDALSAIIGMCIELENSGEPAPEVVEETEFDFI